MKDVFKALPYLALLLLLACLSARAERRGSSDFGNFAGEQRPSGSWGGGWATVAAGATGGAAAAS